jgi:hypothetical protein
MERTRAGCMPHRSPEKMMVLLVLATFGYKTWFLVCFVLRMSMVKAYRFIQVEVV